jgi:hypothetical protein
MHHVIYAVILPNMIKSLTWFILMPFYDNFMVYLVPQKCMCSHYFMCIILGSEQTWHVFVTLALKSYSNILILL